MDLNEDPLINNQQVRAHSRLLFLRDTPSPLSLSFLSLFFSPSELLMFREPRKDGRPKGWTQTGPEHEDGCGPRRRRHLAGLPPDFQLYFVAKGAENGSSAATPCIGGEKNCRVNSNVTFVLIRFFESGKGCRTTAV